MRRTWLVAGVAVITALTACGGTSSVEGSASADSPSPEVVDLAGIIRIAAEDTQGQEWLKTTMTVSGGPGTNLTMTYQGSTDGLNGILTTDAGGAAIPGATFEARIVDGVFYMKFPDLGADAPVASGGWIEIDPSVDGTNPFTDATGFGVESLTRVFEGLKNASDEVENLGAEDLDGVSTTHYRLTLSGDGLLGAHGDDVPAVPEGFEDALAYQTVVDVWVDDAGLIRRMQSVIDVGGPTASDETGAEFGPITMTWEITELGEPVDVKPPPADEVQSFEDMFGELFGELGFDPDSLGQAPDELRELMEGFETGDAGDLEQQIDEYTQDLEQFGSDVEQQLEDLFSDQAD